MAPARKTTRKRAARPAKPAKTHRFTMVMTPEDRDKLDKLSEQTGSAAQWICSHIREQYKLLKGK